MKISRTAKRLKETVAVINPTSQSEDPEARAKILDSSINMASGNVNFAGVFGGATVFITNARGPAIIDQRVNESTITPANAN